MLGTATQDGAWISDEEAFARMRRLISRAHPDPPQLPEQVDLATPGERYPEVVLRESAALLGAGLGLSGLLLFTILRRRPG